jgi:hypothetical protein
MIEGRTGKRLFADAERGVICGDRSLDPAG